MNPGGLQRQARLRAFALCIALVAVAASARIVWIQGARHAHYEAIALDQASERIKVDLPRAALLDREGRPLAASVRCPSLFTFRPDRIAQKGQLASAVAQISGEDPREILKDLQTRSKFTWLAQKLPFEQYPAAEALCKQFPGVEIWEDWGRVYPGGPLAANLLGCMGTDKGLAGLEADWDTALKGGTREYVAMRDAIATKIIPLEMVPQVEEEPPAVKLTLDSALQFYSEQVLQAAVEETRARTGVALVLDVRSGEILSMAVRPTFDPNFPKSSPRANWRNHAVLDAYEPGSTFKIVTLAAALESGRYTISSPIVVGNGKLTIGPKTISDDHPPTKAVYTLEEVLAHSSNVGCAKIGGVLGKEILYRQIQLFGFGAPTALGLQGEPGGILRPPSKWSDLSLPSLSFGQELTSTPLQLVLAYAAVASGGMRVTPKLVADAPVPPPERILKAETARALNTMLQSVVTDGTGEAATIPGILTAGKTGTAQKIGHVSSDGRKLYVAYFVGFAPADDPKIVTLVMVDEPVGKIYGGAISAPAWQKITAFALKRLSQRPAVPAPLDLARAGGPR